MPTMQMQHYTWLSSLPRNSLFDWQASRQRPWHFSVCQRKALARGVLEARQHTTLFSHAILNLLFVPITIKVRRGTSNGAHNAVSRIPTKQVLMTLGSEPI